MYSGTMIATVTTREMMMQGIPDRNVRATMCIGTSTDIVRIRRNKASAILSSISLNLSPVSDDRMKKVTMEAVIIPSVIRNTMDSDSTSFYDRDPEGYSGKTFTADVSDLRDRFTSLLPGGASVLDLGCGSGRDSLAFHEMGFRVTSIDGSEGMCRIARENTGLDVRHLLFRDLDYIDRFDGVWACSTLLHVPSHELPAVLSLVHRSLHADGVFYMSFKDGVFEGERDGRYYTDMSVDDIPSIASSNGFDVIDVWNSVEPDRDILWTNALLRRKG